MSTPPRKRKFDHNFHSNIYVHDISNKKYPHVSVFIGKMAQRRRYAQKFLTKPQFTKSVYKIQSFSNSNNKNQT